MKDSRRAALHGFLTAAATGGEPRAADYAEMQLPEPAERVLRAAVRAVRKTARPAAGSRHNARAQEVVDELVPDLVAALPESWEAPSSDPVALANTVPRGGYPG